MKTFHVEDSLDNSVLINKLEHLTNGELKRTRNAMGLISFIIFEHLDAYASNSEIEAKLTTLSRLILPEEKIFAVVLKHMKKVQMSNRGV